MTDLEVRVMRVCVVLMVLVAAVWVPAVAVAELPPGGSFSDDNGSPFEGWIEAVAAEGVANGIGDGMFGPDRSVTRAEMAAFLVRAVDAVPSAVSVSRFPDVSGWALGYVETAADLGITVGYGDGTFRPDALVSRAEMAVFMVRALGLSEAAVSGVFSDVPASAWFAGAVEAIRAEGITLGCSTSPVAYCPHGAVTRGQMAAFIGRALDLEPITPPPVVYASDFAAFTAALPRAVFDHPDDSPLPSIKVLYVMPSDGEDRQRDQNGQLAQAIYRTNAWFASQNGGIGLRFDTSQGSLDVGFVRLDISRDELAALWDNGMSDFQDVLRANGVPIERVVNGEQGGDVGRFYFIYLEAPAGNYFKTGTSSGCRQVVDAANFGHAWVGQTLEHEPGVSCWGGLDAFPFEGSVQDQLYWRGFGEAVDVLIQRLRFLPGCGYPVSPEDGEPYQVPGTDIVEIRTGFIRDLLEPNDPLAKLDGGKGFPYEATDSPMLDPTREYYFKISNGSLADTECNSDIAKSPFWDTRTFR